MGAAAVLVAGCCCSREEQRRRVNDALYSVARRPPLAAAYIEEEGCLCCTARAITEMAGRLLLVYTEEESGVPPLDTVVVPRAGARYMTSERRSNAFNASNFLYDEERQVVWLYALCGGDQRGEGVVFYTSVCRVLLGCM
jgi:hypothetical protein